MARQLWLLRHGEAVPHDSKPDDDRELTPRGERQARDAGAALAALNLEFAACYTSPKIRARDTARLACEHLNVEPEEVAALGEEFDYRDALELFHAHDADAHVLAVGHEPDFSQVVFDFTGGRVDFKKGGIAGLRVEGGSGELLVLMRPREIEALATR
jgi:phosphohistidine phosphatase